MKDQIESNAKNGVLDFIPMRNWCIRPEGESRWILILTISSFGSRFRLSFRYEYTHIAHMANANRSHPMNYSCWKNGISETQRVLVCWVWDAFHKRRRVHAVFSLDSIYCDNNSSCAMSFVWFCCLFIRYALFRYALPNVHIVNHSLQLNESCDDNTWFVCAVAGKTSTEFVRSVLKYAVAQSSICVLYYFFLVFPGNLVAHVSSDSAYDLNTDAVCLHTEFRIQLLDHTHWVDPFRWLLHSASLSSPFFSLLIATIFILRFHERKKSSHWPMWTWSEFFWCSTRCFICRIKSYLWIDNGCCVRLYFLCWSEDQFLIFAVIDWEKCISSQSFWLSQSMGVRFSFDSYTVDEKVSHLMSFSELVMTWTRGIEGD